MLFRSLIATGLLLLTVANSDAQQQKRDIFGFSPGMSPAEVKDRVIAKQMSCGSLDRRLVTCDSDTGKLTLEFTRIDPRVLYKITSEFISADNPEAIARSISTQFSKTASLSRKFDDASYYLWELGGKREDHLSLKTGAPNILSLFSNAIAKADANAMRDVIRKRYPTPKF